MKNNTISGIEKRIPMRQEIFGRKSKIPWYFLLLLFLTSAVEAQNSVLFLTWDVEVGCVNGINDDPRDPKDYFELIAAGESLRVCQGATVVYTLHGYESSWTDVLWDVAGGTIINLTPDKTICTVLWGNGVVGSIGATILTTGDTRVLPDLDIELIKKPKALFWKAPFDFTTDLFLGAVIEVCAGETFTFANGSFANGGTPIVSYHWDFGDGTTSTEFEPSHVYTESGETHTVTLTVTNQCNCKSSVKHDVKVGKKSVNIICPAVVCEGEKATYKIADLGNNQCEPFDWDVQGGVILSEQPYGSKIEVLWTPFGIMNNTIGGFGYVSFDPRGCGLDCYAETSLKIPVITDNMDFEGPSSVCGNSQNRYTMPQWPTTDFVWEVINSGGTEAFVVLTDQRNEIILNPGTVAGTITLRVTYQNTLLNCGGTSEKTINIKKDALIRGPLEVCLNQEVQYYLQDSDEIVNWRLKLLPNGPTTQGSGPVLNTIFTTAGNYSLTIIGTTICNSEAVIIKVRSPEIPLDADIIGSRVVCPSAPSEFSIVNTIPGTIIGWSIPPGVGTIVGSSYGDDIQVIWKYPTEPVPDLPYTINVWRETTTDPACKSDELTITLAPEDLELGIEGAQESCGSVYQEYSVPETTGDTYEWSIADPLYGSILVNGGNEITILWNQFSSSRTTSVNLKVTKCNIPYFSSPYQVTIDNPRIEIVQPTGTFCPGDPIAFSLNPSVPLDVVTSNIIWEFGDGSPAQYGTNVQHEYQSGGTYSVSVRVIQPNGCLFTLSQSTSVVINPDSIVTIANPIVAACSPNPFSVTFEAQLGAGTTVLGWYAAVDNTYLGMGDTLTVSEYGSYYVEVASGFCIKKAFCRVIDCSPPCVPSPVPSLTLSATPGCSTISATGSFDIPGPTDFNWGSNFITDSLVTGSTNTNATFAFSEPGDHIISYDIAYNNQDCYTRTTTSVFIPYVPRVDAVISCGINNYILTITDESLIHTSTTPSYVFKVNGNTIDQGANPANSRVIPATVGTFVIEMIISGGAYSCTVSKTITVPAFPDATFTVADEVCQGYSAGFMVSNVVPGDSYSWDFGDNSFNSMQNPNKEYDVAIGYFPTLTVANAYCNASYTRPITVLQNEQFGFIDPPAIGCPGGSTALSFSSTGSPESASVQWLFNNEPLLGATNNPQTVSQSGSYSIEVETADGCKKRIAQSVPVAIARPPFSNIQGPTTVCENQPFKLFVKAGSQANGLIYEWREGSTILSTTPTLAFGALSGGIYTYTLTVKIPIAGGGFCTMPTLTHTVSVVGLPTVTATSTLNCESSFTVNLSAFSSELGGVYNWSNGASGANISDVNGGAFQVIYTSEAGCKGFFDIEVPKNPENYLWIFPYGCYTFCSEFNTGTLIGPSIKDFDKWKWLKDSDIALEGGSPVEVLPYDLNNASNSYNLQLETGQCIALSKKMTVEIIDCDCEIGAEIRGVIPQTVPFNHYQVSIYITNPSTVPQQVMVLAPNELGVMTPSSVTVPNPGALFTFMLLPDTTFFGGSNFIKLKTTGGDGQLCETDLEAHFPSFGPSGEQRNGTNSVTQTKLTVVPNPANDQTQLHYDFGNSSLLATTSIEVYDIYGRQLEQLSPTESAASWEINTSVYQTGIYVIVMKQDGKIVQQKNLVITH